MSEEEIKLGNNIQEFEEIFGNVPIKNLDNIRKYIADNYVSLDLYNKEKEKNKLLIEGKFREVADKNSYIKDNYISKDKIKELADDYESKGYIEIAGAMRELLEERR